VFWLIVGLSKYWIPWLRFLDSLFLPWVCPDLIVAGLVGYGGTGKDTMLASGLMVQKV
jgi:hypothetical protein